MTFRQALFVILSGGGREHYLSLFDLDLYRIAQLYTWF